MEVVMNTDQLQPSVWLDALVAEKVMEKERVVVVDSPYVFNSLPRYSSDIEAVWEVVKKITGHVFVAYCPRIFINYFSTGYVHVFFRAKDDDGTGEHLCEGVATTFPLAVCRCALKVVDRYEKFGYEYERYQGKGERMAAAKMTSNLASGVS